MTDNRPTLGEIARMPQEIGDRYLEPSATTPEPITHERLLLTHGWVTDYIRAAHEAAPSGLPFWRIHGHRERLAEPIPLGTTAFPAIVDEEAAKAALRKLRSGEDPARDSLREGERWASFELVRYEPWVLVFREEVQP